jgi:hypothetical protein
MSRLVPPLCTALLLLAGAADAEEKAKSHKLSVEFSVPDPLHKGGITEVRQVGKELWVRVDVRKEKGIAPSVIGKVKDSVTVDAPDLPVKYFVFGKTWGWKNEEKGITFLKDLDDKERVKLEKAFAGGKVVYQKKKGKD